MFVVTQRSSIAALANLVNKLLNALRATVPSLVFITVRTVEMQTD